MRKILILAVLALLLSSCAHAEKNTVEIKNPLGGECSVPGTAKRGEEFMKAFFGNYHRLLGVSALDSFAVDDPNLRQWTFGGAISDLLFDWEDLDSATQEQFIQILDKIPFRFLNLYLLADNKALLAFEAGNWNVISTMWGGCGFTDSHNLGMAAFALDSGVWRLTGYDLNLGRFGSYCNTRLDDRPIKIGKNEYGVMSDDFGAGLFGILDGKPVVLLRIPQVYGYGHGDPEDFESEIVFKPTRGRFYDLEITSSGKNWDTEEELNHFRRWTWNAKSNRYELQESRGNIQSILQDPEYWLLDEEFY